MNVNFHILAYPIFATIYSKLIFYNFSKPLERSEI